MPINHLKKVHMRNLTTPQYIKLLFTHNWNVLFAMFHMEFYKLFDWFEMLYWCRIQKRGSVGDYHLAKLAQISKQKETAEELDINFMVYDLIIRLQYSSELSRNISFSFYLPAYNRFIFDRLVLNHMSLVLQVKDRKTLLDVGDTLGFGFRDRFYKLHGAQALSEYEMNLKENKE